METKQEELENYDQPPRINLVPRSCLCCDKGFLARGRFERLCRACKELMGVAS